MAVRDTRDRVLGCRPLAGTELRTCAIVAENRTTWELHFRETGLSGKVAAVGKLANDLLRNLGGLRDVLLVTHEVERIVEVGRQTVDPQED